MNDPFFVVDRPPTIWTARVNGTPTTPFMTIPYSGAVTVRTPAVGMTVKFGSTSGGRDRGIARLKRAPNGTDLIIGESPTRLNIQANDYISVLEQFLVWPVFPRIVSGTPEIFYEDYDVAYANQTLVMGPTAVIGPPQVVKQNGTNSKTYWTGDQSYSVEDGVTITGYAWSAPASVEGTSSAQGTPASPVVFTFATRGRYLIKLTVTDSNGNTHTTYTYAYVVDTSTSDVFLAVNNPSISGGFEDGGWTGDLTLQAQSDESVFPLDSFVLMCRETPLQHRTATWPFRDNLMYWGWYTNHDVNLDWPMGSVTLKTGTIDTIMKNLRGFALSIQDKATPTTWNHMRTMRCDRLAQMLLTIRSTTSLIVPSTRFVNTKLIRYQDFGPVNLWSQLQDQLINDAFGRVAVSVQGVLHMELDAFRALESEKTGFTSRRAINRADWLLPVKVGKQERAAQSTSDLKSEGIFYPGGEAAVTALFSIAPGPTPNETGQPEKLSRLILSSQAELNARCGIDYSKKLNSRSFSARFFEDGEFDIVPQEFFTATVLDSDSLEGISFSGVRVVPRKITRNFSGQTMLDEIDFEVEFTSITGSVDQQDQIPPTGIPPDNTFPPPGPGGPPTGTDNTDFSYDIADGVNFALSASSTEHCLYFTAPRNFTIQGLTAFCAQVEFEIKLYVASAQPVLIFGRTVLGKWYVDRYDGAGLLLTHWIDTVSSTSIDYGLSGSDQVGVIEGQIFQTDVVTHSSPAVQRIGYGFRGIP